MTRTHLNKLITHRSLAFVLNNFSQNDSLTEKILDQASDPAIKNVCAKVAASLADDIDEVCGLLGMSKRQFLEAAMIDALAEAHRIMADEGVWEHIEANHSSPNPAKD